MHSVFTTAEQIHNAMDANSWKTLFSHSCFFVVRSKAASKIRLIMGVADNTSPSLYHEPTPSGKLWAKTKKTPFVPMGECW